MIDNYLISLNACKDAREWAKGKSWKEVFDTCHRGDWILWLYRMQENFDLRKFTLAKGHCANTVRHLMKDERSINAVDTAIKYGEGKCDRDELDAATYAAYAADAAAYSYAAAYAADAAAYVAADAAYAAAAAAYAYAAADDADDAAYAVRKQCADICRQYLPFEIWNIKEYQFNLK